VCGSGAFASRLHLPQVQNAGYLSESFFDVRVRAGSSEKRASSAVGLAHEVHAIEIGDDRAARLIMNKADMQGSTGAIATVCYSVLQLIL
jgi:hypothetical protein